MNNLRFPKMRCFPRSVSNCPCLSDGAVVRSRDACCFKQRQLKRTRLAWGRPVTYIASAGRACNIQQTTLGAETAATGRRARALRCVTDVCVRLVGWKWMNYTFLTTIWVPPLTQTTDNATMAGSLGYSAFEHWYSCLCNVCVGGGGTCS